MASGYDYWFASDYTGLDAQMIEHMQAQVCGFFSIASDFKDWAGEKQILLPAFDSTAPYIVEIQPKSPYEIMVAPYGKRCAEIQFGVSELPAKVHGRRRIS